MERLESKILYKGKSAAYLVAGSSFAITAASGSFRLISEGLVHASNETLQLINSAIMISLSTGLSALFLVSLIDRKIQQLKGGQNVQHTNQESAN